MSDDNVANDQQVQEEGQQQAQVAGNGSTNGDGEAGGKEPLSGYPGMLSAEKSGINSGTTSLVYAAPISDKIVMAHFVQSQMFFFSFALCHSKELKKASYVHLYEDRLEWNFPTSVCMQIIDRPGVLYLDRDVAELQTVPDCCRPMCTHCNCCPTFWDLSGEVLMLHGMNTCCYAKGAKASVFSVGMQSGCPQLCVGRPMPILNRHWMMIPHLEDALKLKFEVRKVRKDLVDRGLAQQLTGSPNAEAQSRD